METDKDVILQPLTTNIGTLPFGEDSKRNPSERHEGYKHSRLSFREKWRDPEYRGKLTYSMFMSLSYMALGAYMGEHGPTLLDLQIITNTDLETASLLFTGGYAGYLGGSILVGLFYNKVNTSMLCFVLLLCLGVSNIFQPYCTHIEVMVAVRFASAAFGGGLDTGLNSEHMVLWGSHGNELLQFMHFCFSLGGFISPLVAEPFLAEKIDQEMTNLTTNETFYNNSSAYAVQPETNVHYVFWITGIFVIITSFPFIVMYFKRSEFSKDTEKDRKFSQRNVPFTIQMFMLCGLCLFYFTYWGVETTFFAYLMTFLVGEFDSVSKSKGAFVTAIAWAAFSVARLFMIFIAKMFTSAQILFILTTLLAISFSSMTLFAHFGVVNALFFISAVVALAFSGIFPAGLSWTEKEMFPVTGVISSCVLVSGCAGSMIDPLVLGNLMEQHTNMWFCYLLLGETIVMYILFLCLMVFCRFYVDGRYGSLTSHYNKTLEMEFEITAHGIKDERKEGETMNSVQS